MLELSDDEFKAGIIKMFQKQLQTQVKKKKSQPKNRSCKGALTGNFKTENMITKNIKT